MRIYRDMRSRNISPDQATYIQLILLCGKSQQRELANTLFQEMKACGVSANEFIYGSVIGLNVRANRTEEAMQVRTER
jgi:pentatricopeptide repeat protein